MRRRLGIELVEKALRKLPAVLAHGGLGVGDGDGLLQTLQRAHYERAVRPRAALRDVKPIAPGLRLAHAVAERALGPHEGAAGGGGVARNVLPHALYQHSHGAEYSAHAQQPFLLEEETCVGLSGCHFFWRRCRSPSSRKAGNRRRTWSS